MQHDAPFVVGLVSEPAGDALDLLDHAVVAPGPGVRDTELEEAFDLWPLWYRLMWPEAFEEALDRSAELRAADLIERSSAPGKPAPMSARGCMWSWVPDGRHTAA